MRIINQKIINMARTVDYTKKIEKLKAGLDELGLIFTAQRTATQSEEEPVAPQKIILANIDLDAYSIDELWKHHKKVAKALQNKSKK